VNNVLWLETVGSGENEEYIITPHTDDPTHVGIFQLRLAV